MTHKKNTTRKLGSRVKTPGQRSQSTRLVELVSGAELFHTPDGEPFATTHLQGHPETWPVRSQEFRGWLERRFYLQERRAPSSTAVKDASNLLAARARFDGAEREVFVRVAEHGDIYVDLGNQSRKALRISARGYEVVPNPPVKFRRASGMLALPYPEGHGRIGSLRPFLNVAGNDQWLLLLGWLIGAFSPRGPYPLLVLQGEQGSAKSTTARVLRALIDPHTTPLRGAPRETRDLMISAINSWVQVFDNLSRVPADLSDDLCRLSTGGGLATRALYTDTDEVFLAAQRPVILTGIEGLVTRPDLLDRAIIIYLPNILDRARRAEREFWQRFEKARPRILGALLKAVSTALRRLPRVRLAEWLQGSPSSIPSNST